MADDKHSLHRLSPVSACDSSEGNSEPVDFRDSHALPKYGYKKKMNTENVPTSKTSGFKVKKKRAHSSQPAQTNSEVPMPVYSKKSRFLDQLMPQLKPPANLSWPTTKHKKRNKGTYKNHQGINSLETEKRSLANLSLESTTCSYYEDSQQVHCNSPTGSRKITENDGSPFSSLGHPDSASHDPSVPSASTSKCSQKEESHKFSEQLQTESREKTKSTVIPSSSKLHSHVVDDESGINTVTSRSLEPSNKCLASVTVNTTKSNDLTTTIMREHIYDEIRSEQQTNSTRSPYTLSTTPVVPGLQKNQDATPLAKDNNSLKKGQNIRDIPCFYIDAPTNIIQISPQGFMPIAQHLNETESAKTGEIRQHNLLSSFNISQTKPLQGPQPQNPGIHAFSDNSETIPRIPRRATQPSVSPFLSASLRSQTEAYPVKKRSPSLSYMDALNRRSKSAQSNKERSTRSPKHLSQTPHFSEAHTAGSPFIEGHHQLTVPSSRKPRHSPVFNAPAHHSLKQTEPTPKALPQQAVSCIRVNSQPNSNIERLLHSNPINPPIPLPLNFSPVFLPLVPQNMHSSCPSADVNHPRFGGCLEKHDVSLPKPLPLQPQTMISRLMPPLLRTACRPNTNVKSLKLFENSTIKEADSFKTQKMGHNPEHGNLPDSKSAFTGYAFKPCSSSDHDQAAGCATGGICSASKLVNSQDIKSQARESRHLVPNSSVCTGYMSSLPANVYHLEKDSVHNPATASLIKRISNPPLLIQCNNNALNPSSFSQQASSYQPRLRSQRGTNSSPLEHELAIHLISPPSTSQFGGKPNLSEEGSEKDNTDNASSQQMAVETVPQFLEGATDKGNAKTRILKRQRDLHGKQSQETASPTKRMRNENLSVVPTPTYNPPVCVGNAPGIHETQSSQVQSRNLEIVVKTTTAQTADAPAEVVETLTKDPPTGGILGKLEMDMIQIKSNKVTVRETSTETTPKTQSAFDSAGKETDRKYTLPNHSLPNNCTISDVSTPTKKSLAASKLQQYCRLPNTVQSHKPSLTPTQALGTQGLQTIPKRYVQRPDSIQFLASTSKNTDLSTQTMGNRQKGKEYIEQDHEDKQSDVPKTLPVPFVVKWRGHTTPPLETSIQQVSLNLNTQRRKHITEPNTSASIPTGNMCKGELKYQRSTTPKKALVNDKGKLADHSPKPVVASSVKKQCLSDLSRLCVRPPRESRDIGMHQVLSHLPPTTKHSHCNNHNGTANSNVTTPELDKHDDSNKEKNAGNRPLRFHVITDFLARETTSQKNAFSVMQTSPHETEKRKEKRGLYKNSHPSTNKIDERRVHIKFRQTQEENKEKSSEKAAKTKTSKAGLEEGSAEETDITVVHPSHQREISRPKEKVTAEERSNLAKESSKSKLNVSTSAITVESTSIGLSGYRIARKILKDKRTAHIDKGCTSNNASEMSAERMKKHKSIPKLQPFNSAQLNPSKSVSPNAQATRKKENETETQNGAPLVGERVRWTNLARMCGLANANPDECSGAMTARTKIVQRPTPNTTSVASSTASKVSKWSKYQAKSTGVAKTSDCKIMAYERQKEEQQDSTEERNSVSCKSNPRNFLDIATDDSTLHLLQKTVSSDTANQFSATSKHVSSTELQTLGSNISSKSKRIPHCQADIQLVAKRSQHKAFSLAQCTGITITPTKTILDSSKFLSPTDLQWDVAEIGVKTHCATPTSSSVNARVTKSVTAKLPITDPLDTTVVSSIPPTESTNTMPLQVRPFKELTGKLQSTTLPKLAQSTDTPSNTITDTPLPESIDVLQSTRPAPSHTSIKQLQLKQGPNIPESKPLITVATNNAQRKDTLTTTNPNTSSPKGRLTGTSDTSAATVECIRSPVVEHIKYKVPNGPQTFIPVKTIKSFSGTLSPSAVPSLISKNVPPMKSTKSVSSSSVCTKFTAPNSSDSKQSKQPIGQLSMVIPISVALGAQRRDIITTGAPRSQSRKIPSSEIKTTGVPSSPSPNAQCTGIKSTVVPRSRPMNLATMPGNELLAKKTTLAKIARTFTSAKQTLSRNNEYLTSSPCQPASNVSSEQFSIISSRQTPRTSTKLSKYLPEPTKGPSKKISIDVSREIVTSSNDQIFSKCSQPINEPALTTSIGSTSNLSRKKITFERELSTTMSGDQTTHKINLPHKADVSEQKNVISNDSFSTGSTVMTHLHNQSNPSGITSGVEIAGASSMGSLTAAQGIRLRKHKTVLPRSSLSYDPSSKPGNLSNIAQITSAKTLPYNTVQHLSSPIRGPDATYSDKCNTTDITATKPIAVGSSTMVTWAILNSIDPSTPNLGPSCTPPNSGVTMDNRPAKDPGRSNFETLVAKEANISSDNSTNLTWLITPGPWSTPCVFQENQKELTNQCKSQSLATQHIKEQHGQKTDSNASDGQDMSVSSSVTDIKTLAQWYSGVETTNQFTFRPAVQTSVAYTGVRYQKQYSQSLSQEHLQNMGSTCRAASSQTIAQDMVGLDSHVVKHSAVTQPEHQNSEKRITGLNTKDVPDTGLIDGESREIEERETVVSSRLRQSLSNSALQPLPNLDRDDVLSRDEVHTKGLSNNRFCQTGTPHSPKDSLLHYFQQKPLSSAQRKERGSKETITQHITVLPADSHSVTSNSNEIIDEFAGPDDCLPCIISAFSLQNRPDVQEQIKNFGSFQHIEVDATLSKHIIHSLGK